MININKFFYLIFCFINLKVNAQLQSIESGNYGTSGTIRVNNISDFEYKVLEGSPYLSKDFLSGSILVSISKKIWLNNQKIRLNTYTNELEILEGGMVKSASAKDVRSFKIGDMTYSAGFPAVDKQSVFSFYQILFEGNVKLLKNSSTIMQEVKSADDVKQGDKFTTYHYYYILDNDKMQRFLPTKKSFLKLMPKEKLDDINKFISEKDLKFKNDNDFTEVIKYSESIKI